jgi:hypothetical protein
MKSSASIISAERMGDSVFIEFADGKSALYSSSLLYALLPQVDPVNVSDLESQLEAEDDS